MSEPLDMDVDDDEPLDDDEQLTAEMLEFLRGVKEELPPGIVKLLIMDGRLRDKLCQQLKEFDPLEGELGLAKQFTIAAANLYRYSKAEKMWLHYDESTGIWTDGDRDARELVQALMVAALMMGRRALVVAIKSGVTESLKSAKTRLSLISKLQKASTIRGVLEIAHTHTPLFVDGPNSFNQDRDLICVRNGVVNLTTGKLSPHKPELMMRMSANVNYDPEAKCETWDKSLPEMFLEDEELIWFFQCALGYTLTGHVSNEVMFIMYGTGSNGKSVIANLLAHILDAYAKQAAGEFMMVSRNAAGNREGASPLLASLAGKRLLSINEVENRAEFSSSQVKILSGTERISARPLYGDPVEFDPTHKVWIRLNQKPIVRDITPGFWRRMKLIPFLRRFSEAEADMTLESKLLAERDGIFAWMVRGAMGWYANERKLPPCQAVRNATKSYETDSDLIGNWLAEKWFLGDPKAETVAETVYTSYKEWCEREGLAAMSQPSLTRQLDGQHISTKRMRPKGGGSPARYYVGIRYPTAAEAAAAKAAVEEVGEHTSFDPFDA